MRFFVIIGLLLYALCAQEVSLATPEQAVQEYYYAMNHADIQRLEKVMVKESFDMTIQVWALSIALKDRAFHEVLRQYGSSSEIDEEVKEAVRKKLLRSPAKRITELRATPLGVSRCVIRYKEDGKAKQLFTSLHGTDWKIDYKAARRVD